MAMKGIRAGGYLVGRSELVVSIVEFVHRLMVTVCEDRRLGLVGIVIRTRLMLFFGLDQLRNVFGNRVEVFLERTGAARTMLTTAGIGF